MARMLLTAQPAAGVRIRRGKRPGHAPSSLPNKMLAALAPEKRSAAAATAGNMATRKAQTAKKKKKADGRKAKWKEGTGDLP